MRKHLRIFCALLAIITALGTAGAFSRTYELSPALEIISEGLELKKCTVPGKDVNFTLSDFEDVFGTTLEYITITSIPESSVGVLKYAGTDVFENQSIMRKNISMLRFVPNGSADTVASFGFCKDGEYPESSSLCTISILDSVNVAPSITQQSFNALSGIGLVKTLSAFDADGDALELEIVSYPENGILKLEGSGFTYTSSGNFKGNDSFSYRAVDVYGNKSESTTVTISVEKSKSNIRFDDMTGHWAYTSAVKMAEMGLMGGEVNGEKLCFNPDEPINRGDFLAMAMIVAGLEEKVELGSRTTFADDEGIPSNIKSYASYAAASGIISGYVTESGTAVFGSGDSITRAEAASVLAKILETESSVCNYTFVDAMSVPEWAKSSFNSLVNLGIINGTTGGVLAPQGELTKAQAAELLCNTMDYLEQKEKEQQEEKGFFQKILDFFR